MVLLAKLEGQLRVQRLLDLLLVETVAAARRADHAGPALEHGEAAQHLDGLQVQDARDHAGVELAALDRRHVEDLAVLVGEPLQSNGDETADRRGHRERRQVAGLDVGPVGQSPQHPSLAQRPDEFQDEQGHAVRLLGDPAAEALREGLAVEGLREEPDDVGRREPLERHAAEALEPLEDRALRVGKAALVGRRDDEDASMLGRTGERRSGASDALLAREVDVVDEPQDRRVLRRATGGIDT